MSAQSNRKPVQPEEYLAQERRAETKSEYVDGVIYGMAGASWNHVQLVGNFTENLRPRLRSQGCTAVSNDLKINTPDGLKFYYPDVAVVCGPPQFHDTRADVLLNPAVLVEVLSSSTTSRDKGEKLWAYQRIPTLREYVLVHQDRAAIEQYVKDENGDWRYYVTIGLDSEIQLSTLGLTLMLNKIYRDAVWENLDAEEPSGA
jgi:Uma2 family endonuclease